VWIGTKILDKPTERLSFFSFSISFEQQINAGKKKAQATTKI
jgi:hypothetical protein